MTHSKKRCIESFRSPFLDRLFGIDELVDDVEMIDNPLNKKSMKDWRSLREALVFVNTNLVQKWIFFQAYQELIYLFFLLFFCCFFFLKLDYGQKELQYMNEQFSSFNCSIIETQVLDYQVSDVFQMGLSKPFSNCGQLNNRNQYFTSSGVVENVQCHSYNGVNPSFYYPNNIFETYSSNYSLQLFLNFVIPFILSYGVFTMVYIALFDCLPIQWKSNKLQYVDNIVRLGWYVGVNEEGRTLEQLPGIKFGMNTLVALNSVIIIVILITCLSFSNSTSSVERCLRSKTNTTLIVVSVVFIILMILIVLLGIGYKCSLKRYPKKMDYYLTIYKFSHIFVHRQSSDFPRWYERSLMDFLLVPLSLPIILITNLLRYNQDDHRNRNDSLRYNQDDHRNRNDSLPISNSSCMNRFICFHKDLILHEDSRADSEEMT